MVINSDVVFLLFFLQKTWSSTLEAPTACVPVLPWSLLTWRVGSRFGTWWRTMSMETRRRVTAAARWSRRSTWHDFWLPRWAILIYWYWVTLSGDLSFMLNIHFIQICIILQGDFTATLSLLSCIFNNCMWKCLFFLEQFSRWKAKRPL